jgi:hypothetical protein
LLTLSYRQHRRAGWLFVLFLIGCPAVNAVEVTTLYTAEVPLDPGARNQREAAYEMALNDVLMRVSGAALVSDPELVEALFPEPAAYVVQFQPGVDDSLIVTFDGAAIETVLRNAGQTVWGTERPLTLAWLAVDWGGGERELLGVDDPLREEDDARSIDRTELLRERLLSIAELYGLPLVLPLLDSEDRMQVSYADVRGGFDEIVLAASERYEVDSILIGVFDAEEGGEPNQWRYYFGSEQFSWRGEPEQVVPQVAEVLAAEFAVQGDAPLERVALTVAGIESVDAYGDLQLRLAEISAIERFDIERVEGDKITYRVDVRGGGERLARALRFAGLLESERIEYGVDFDSGALSSGSAPISGSAPSSGPAPSSEPALSSDPALGAEPALEFYYEPR